MTTKTMPIQAEIRLRDRMTGVAKRVGSGLKRGLGRAIDFTARKGRMLGGVLRNVTSRVALLGGGAVVGAALGVSRLATSYAEAGDHIAKFSRRAGISAQAYQELKHAANLAGISASEFDKAIEKGVRSIGDMKAGQGALNTMLKRVAPAFRKQVLGAKTSTQALDLLIAGMSRIEDPTKRAAFAAAAFGRSGQKMTLIMEKGPKALAEAREEFRKLGGVIEDDALKAAEDFVDDSARMKVAVTGLKNAIGRDLLPVLTPMIQGFTRWVAANRGIVGQKVSGWIRTVGTALGRIDWGAVGSTVVAVAKGFGKLIGAFSDTRVALVALGAVVAVNPLLGLATAAVVIAANWDKVESKLRDVWRLINQIDAAQSRSAADSRGALQTDVLTGGERKELEKLRTARDLHQKTGGLLDAPIQLLSAIPGLGKVKDATGFGFDADRLNELETIERLRKKAAGGDDAVVRRRAARGRARSANVRDIVQSGGTLKAETRVEVRLKNAPAGTTAAVTKADPNVKTVVDTGSRRVGR